MSTRTLQHIVLFLTLALAPAAVAQDVHEPPADVPLPLATSEEVGLSQTVLDQLADSVAAWVAAGEVVGAEVLIAKDGRIAFHEAFGWADRDAHRPLQTGALFNVASMTKPVVGTAVLMLAEEGALSLDDPVARYLPSFDHAASRGITVRHLLTHTAGFDWWGPFALRAEVAEQPGLRAAVDSAGAAGPQFPVGERYAYSNMSTMALTALVAEVSGMPAERFLHERIFEPLGMADTHPTYSPEDPWADRALPIYCWDGEAARFEVCWDPAESPRVPFFRGSGGLRTTAADYLRFVALWLNKGRLGEVRLLSEATVEEALRTHAGRVYGYHWQVPESPVTDGLPALFGHSGADGTAAAAFPADDTIVLYFTQSGEGMPTPAPKPFFDLLGDLALLDHVGPYQFDAVLPDGIDALQGPPEALAPYVGTYRTEAEGGGMLRVTEDGGHLVAAFESEEGAWSEALVRVGDGTFAEGTFRNGRVVEFRPPLAYVFAEESGTVEAMELRFEGEVVMAFQRME